MRGWTRAVTETDRCGRCGARLAAGDPVVQIRLVGLRRACLRCAACAGEPVPADLPASMPIRTSIVPRVKPSVLRQRPLWARLGDLARDWGAAQLPPEREPGEEG